MGSDDDAMIRRDDASRARGRWDWLRGKWDPGKKTEQFIADQEQADRELSDELWLAHLAEARQAMADAERVREVGVKSFRLERTGQVGEFEANFDVVDLVMEEKEKMRVAHTAVWNEPMVLTVDLKDVNPDALRALWGQAPIEAEKVGEGGDETRVDMAEGMWHDAAMTMTEDKVLEAAAAVLPEPMVDYMRMNRTREGEFDIEPGFWQTLGEVGTPTSWFDATKVHVDTTGKMTQVSRVDEEIAEAQRRGVPLMAGLTEEALRGEGEALPKTQALDVIEPTMVLPAVQDEAPTRAQVKKSGRAPRRRT